MDNTLGIFQHCSASQAEISTDDESEPFPSPSPSCFNTESNSQARIGHVHNKCLRESSNDYASDSARAEVCYVNHIVGS
jgi:hypothetical protein